MILKPFYAEPAYLPPNHRDIYEMIKKEWALKAPLLN